jgi:transposase-like protein
MEEKQIATIGSFCLNEKCKDYNKINSGNVVKSGKTDKGIHRYICKTCKKSITLDQGNDVLSLSPYRR